MCSVIAAVRLLMIFNTSSASFSSHLCICKEQHTLTAANNPAFCLLYLSSSRFMKTCTRSCHCAGDDLSFIKKSDKHSVFVKKTLYHKELTMYLGSTADIWLICVVSVGCQGWHGASWMMDFPAWMREKQLWMSRLPWHTFSADQSPILPPWACPRPSASIQHK